MYEYSRDYLNNLISKSGVKMGTAKHAAMVAIIELLDDNSVEGLIKSIRADYEGMKFELSRKDKLLEQLEKEILFKKNAIINLGNELKEKRDTVNALNLQIEQLEEDMDKKKLEIMCDGILPEEKSRLLAFDAAMKLMEDRYGRRGVDADQIIRSASNVAANWRHEPKKECT